MNLRLTSVLFLVECGTTSLPQAQSIPDLAKKAEEAKAKKAEEQGKPEGAKDNKDGSDTKDAPKNTFTNSDLKDASSGGTSSSGSSDAKSDAKPTDAKPTPDAKDATASGEKRDEDWWRSHALALQRQREADLTALAAARVHYDSLPAH